MSPVTLPLDLSDSLDSTEFRSAAESIVVFLRVYAPLDPGEDSGSCDTFAGYMHGRW